MNAARDAKTFKAGTAAPQHRSDCERPDHRSEAYVRGMERLVTAVRELSLARDLEHICDITRHAARELTGADGATFILREGDCCYYVDEDAIAPLWKGKKFPMTACISGWAMMHKSSVIIEDILLDERIPQAAYRPTFVKSLAMVPIRAEQPIGAIGNYWARPHAATAEEVRLLQALADSTSVALENVQVYAELENRVRHRTEQLQAANRDLEAFSYSVSHDLRGPLGAIMSFADLLNSQSGTQLNDTGRRHLQRILEAADRMESLIDDLLQLAQITRSDLACEQLDLVEIAREVIDALRRSEPERDVQVVLPSSLPAYADRGLIRIVLENLISNAWKFTRRRERARIELGAGQDATSYFVRDNGAGFDMQHATQLFAPFQRLHSRAQFPGTGIGLATVHRILQKHGGAISAESAVERGATFFFTIPAADGDSAASGRVTS